MSVRQLLGMSALLCVCVAWRPAAQAGAAEAIASQRPVTFTTTIGASGGEAPSVECVVDFGPPLPISAIAFSPDGKTLAVGAYQEVLLWDLEGAKLARRIGIGHLSDMVHAVAFVHGGKSLAVGDGLPYQSGAVKIFSTETGEPTATFDGPKRVVCCLALSPDGKSLAAGDADSLVHVWDLTAAKLSKTIDAHKSWVLGVSFSPDGKRLATASADQTLQVWEVGTWERIVRYDLAATVHGAAFSPDGKTVVGAVGGPDERALCVGRIDSDLQQTERRAPRTQTVSTGSGTPLDVVWPAKGAYAFVPCDDHTVRVYQGTKLTTTLRGHTDWVYCVASTPDGSKLASGSADGTVKLWNVGGGKPLATLIQLSPRTDNWLIITPQGHFTTSSPEAIKWKTTASSTPPEELTGRYHNPDVVRKALATSSTAPYAPQQKDGATPRPPDSSPKKKNK